jgi:hypothetical protein
LAQHKSNIRVARARARYEAWSAKARSAVIAGKWTVAPTTDVDDEVARGMELVLQEDGTVTMRRSAGPGGARVVSAAGGGEGGEARGVAVAVAGGGEMTTRDEKRSATIKIEDTKRRRDGTAGRGVAQRVVRASSHLPSSCASARAAVASSHFGRCGEGHDAVVVG